MNYSEVPASCNPPMDEVLYQSLDSYLNHKVPFSAFFHSLFFFSSSIVIFVFNRPSKEVLTMVRPLLFLASLLPIVSASWNINSETHRHACQKHSKNPLQGCDLQKTKYVDFAGNGSNFKTVQSGM